MVAFFQNAVVDISLLLGANASQVVLDQHVGGGHDGDARQSPVGRGDTEHEHPRDHKRAVNEQKSTEYKHQPYRPPSSQDRAARPAALLP